MRRRLAGNKVLLLGCVMAFVFMMLAAGLPHSHGSAQNPQSHNCSVCRAQSVQPVVDPFVAVEDCPLLLAGMATPTQDFFCLQSTIVLFQSRAPPFLSR